MKSSRHNEIAESTEHANPAALAALAAGRAELAERLEAVADRVVSAWWFTSFDPERIARYAIDGTESLDREQAQKRSKAIMRRFSVPRDRSLPDEG